MRSEAEIRREVEKHFHRWAFLILNGGLWVVVGSGLYLYSRNQGVPAGWLNSVVLFLLLWGLGVGLHLFRTLYIEMREWLVNRALERERRYYDMGDMAYAKPKRREAPRLIAEDDGELIDEALIDFPDGMDEAKVKHGR